jgi:hypothetical protein
MNWWISLAQLVATQQNLFDVNRNFGFHIHPSNGAYSPYRAQASSYEVP